MSGVVHIVGAGLAGLSTALRLRERGRAVRLYEAAPFAGGRCRTFHDPRLGRDVDNGNHLILSGNTSVAGYLHLIGAQDKLVTSDEAAFAFVDLQDESRWRVHLNKGALPWWIFSHGRRIPKTGLGDYVGAYRIAFADQNQTVADAIRQRGPIWQRFWEPLTLAVLNVAPERGTAKLLWQVLKETFLKGGEHCRPMLAPQGLGRALIDPALAMLDTHGVALETDRALKAVEIEDDRLAALHFANRPAITLDAQDTVVMALPPTRLRAVLPDLDGPRDDASILNVHFLVDDPALASVPDITGLVNAETHWVFRRDDVLSLTISAAHETDLMTRDPDQLAEGLWQETAKALNLTTRPHAVRINKERRATIDQSPAENAKRLAPRTVYSNLFLAGDSTDTGLPATIEGAIRSGEIAARLAA